MCQFQIHRYPGKTEADDPDVEAHANAAKAAKKIMATRTRVPVSIENMVYANVARQEGILAPTPNTSKDFCVRL
jgi:hypothetical protein